MNAFDADILIFLNQFAFKSRIFDYAVFTIAGLYFFKGVVLVALMWWVWFIPKEERAEHKREIIVATIISGFSALVAGRLLALYLPFRVRPIYNPDLHLNFPVISTSNFLRSWSAFPSDHAMLWSAVAFGIFLASRRIGVFALAYTAVFICFPRIYMGLHHPSDVLAGAALGIMMVYLANLKSVRPRLALPVLRWSQIHPSSFYMCGFLLSYGMATHFEELKLFGILAVKALLKTH